jgi:hypothetical protein
LGQQVPTTTSTTTTTTTTSVKKQNDDDVFVKPNCLPRSSERKKRVSYVEQQQKEVLSSPAKVLKLDMQKEVFSSPAKVLKLDKKHDVMSSDLFGEDSFIDDFDALDNEENKSTIANNLSCPKTPHYNACSEQLDIHQATVDQSGETSDFLTVSIPVDQQHLLHGKSYFWRPF